MSFSEIYSNIMGLNGLVPAGVVTGDNLIKLMDYCKKNGHALPGKTNLTPKIFLSCLSKNFICSSSLFQHSIAPQLPQSMLFCKQLVISTLQLSFRWTFNVKLYLHRGQKGPILGPVDILSLMHIFSEKVN